MDNTTNYFSGEEYEKKYINEQRPRDYQLFAKDVLGWEVIDLLQDEDTNGYRILSRADLILIFALYNKSGLEGFLNEYLNYANEKYERYGEQAIILKPHNFLKNLIG